MKRRYPVCRLQELAMKLTGSFAPVHAIQRGGRALHLQRRSRLMALFFCLLSAVVAPVALAAQSNNGAANSQAAAARNERIDALLKALEGVDLFGEFRVRPEWQYNYSFDRDNLSCTGSICKTSDDTREFTGMRTQLGVDVKPGGAFSGRLVIQDSRVWGAERGSDTGLVTANDDTRQSLDVREAWLEARAGDFAAQAGRLLLKYGDQRLVGPLEWTNVGRSFDGVRLKYETPAIKSHLWGTTLAEQDSDSSGNSTAVGVRNLDLDDAYFVGWYNTLTLHEHFQAEPYYLGRYFSYVQRTQPIVRSDIATAAGGAPIISSEDRSRDRDNLHTLGLRLTNRTVNDGKRAPGFLDYTIEYAHQSGRTGRVIAPRWDEARVIAPLPGPLFDATNNPCRVFDSALQPDASTVSGCRVYTERERYDAFAFAVELGVTYDDFARVAVEHDIGSGDPSRTDGAVATFNNLFHTNHMHYGQADQISWQNMRAWAVKLSFDFKDAGRVKLAYWRADKHKAQDAWYKVGGGGAAGATVATTESPDNAAYASVYNSDGTLRSLPVGVLRKHLFNEYDLIYEIGAGGFELSTGYSLIVAGDAAGAWRDDRGVKRERFEARVAQDLADGRVDRPAELIAFYTPSFRPRAHFAYVMATYKF
jgi:Alginate export